MIRNKKGKAKIQAENTNVIHVKDERW